MKTKQFPSVVYKMTAPATLAFPNLFTKRAFANGDKQQYDVKVVFNPDHPDLKPISAVMAQLKQQSFPNATAFEFCLRSGDAAIADAVGKGKDPIEFYRGKYVLTARTQFLDKRALGVILNGKLTAVPPEPDSAAFEKYFYGGVEAYLEFDFHCYPAARGPAGVAAWPQSVLSMNRGEYIPEINGGATVSATTVWAHVGTDSPIDPTATAAPDPLAAFR